MIMGRKTEINEINEQLDQFGCELIRAASLSAEEAADAVSSPWMFARLRTRIDSEREGRESREGWSTLLKVIWRAIPATGLATALALGSLFLAGTTGLQADVQFSDQDLFATNDAGVQRVVFADRRPLSSDEVMETIMNGEQEATK